eukprot:EG_transcript_21164
MCVGTGTLVCPPTKPVHHLPCHPGSCAVSVFPPLIAVKSFRDRFPVCSSGCSRAFAFPFPFPFPLSRWRLPLWQGPQQGPPITSNPGQDRGHPRTLAVDWPFVAPNLAAEGNDCRIPFFLSHVPAEALSSEHHRDRDLPSGRPFSLSSPRLFIFYGCSHVAGTDLGCSRPSAPKPPGPDGCQRSSDPWSDVKGATRASDGNRQPKACLPPLGLPLYPSLALWPNCPTQVLCFY